MNEPTVERRRLPRLTLHEESEIELKMSIPVQILELSRAGVLLGSRSELSIGDRAELRGTIGSESFAVAVEVRHVSIETQPRGGTRYRAGAVFAPAGDDQRAALERLLGGESR